MLIINNTSLAESTKYGKEITVGTVFTGSLSPNGVFLRVYCGIVSLTNPNETWTFYGEEGGPIIQNYRSVKATLTIQDF